MAQSSPRKSNVPTSARSFCASAINGPQNCEIFAREMHNKFIHMSCENFLETFVPATASMPQPPNFAGAFNGVRPRSSEETLYKEFMSCMEKSKLCPKYKLVATPYRYQTDDPEKRKVDMGLYPLDKTPSKNDPPRWAHMALYAEFKTKSNCVNCDPFDDNSADEATAIRRRDARGQIISYAAAVHARQQRTFSFSLLVLGDCVRLLRWDRSGAVFTEKFNYRQHPENLGTFFWRFAHLPRDLQGHDLTATPVEKGTDDYKKMKKLQEACAKKDYRRDYFARSLENEEWPWWKLSVEADEGSLPSPEGVSKAGEATASGAQQVHPKKLRKSKKSKKSQESKKMQYFLIGKPHALAPGMTGRGTRGYVALDCETEELVFLKDAWWVDLELMEKEGDILGRLNQTEVKCVPTLVCHGDVGGQSTVTQDYSKKRGHLDNPLKKHAHYRLAVKEIGCSLTEIANAQQLVAVLCCDLIAHFEAYTKARVLHRDVSVGNILMLPRLDADDNMTDNVTGLMNDWDLSKSLDAAPSSRQPDRTGTWQYMSGLLLKDAKKHNELQDDLESVLHVLLWISIRYLKHNCADVGSFMDGFFDSSFVARETVLGGRTKCGDLIAGSIKVSSKDETDVQLRFDSPCINQLVTTMLNWFSAYYRVREANQQLSKTSMSTDGSKDNGVKTPDPQENPIHAWRPSLPHVEVRRTTPALSPDIRKDAETLHDHAQMLTIFYEAMDMPLTQEDEVVGDQLKNYRPDVVAAPRTGDKRRSEVAEIHDSENLERQTKASKTSNGTFTLPRTSSRNSSWQK